MSFFNLLNDSNNEIGCSKGNKGSETEKKPNNSEVESRSPYHSYLRRHRYSLDLPGYCCIYIYIKLARLTKGDPMKILIRTFTFCVKELFNQSLRPVGFSVMLYHAHIYRRNKRVDLSFEKNFSQAVQEQS